MKHPFDRYFAKHGEYPTLRLDNGVQRLTVTFASGYVHIKASSPYYGEVYITRSAWIALLKKAVPLTRKWSHAEDFDVPKAMHENYLLERSILEEDRRAKKTRYRDDGKARSRQHRRWLAAKARGQQRT